MISFNLKKVKLASHQQPTPVKIFRRKSTLKQSRQQNSENAVPNFLPLNESIPSPIRSVDCEHMQPKISFNIKRNVLQNSFSKTGFVNRNMSSNQPDLRQKIMKNGIRIRKQSMKLKIGLNNSLQQSQISETRAQIIHTDPLQKESSQVLTVQHNFIQANQRKVQDFEFEVDKFAEFDQQVVIENTARQQSIAVRDYLNTFPSNISGWKSNNSNKKSEENMINHIKNKNKRTSSCSLSSHESEDRLKYVKNHNKQGTDYIIPTQQKVTYKDYVEEMGLNSESINLVPPSDQDIDLIRQPSIEDMYKRYQDEHLNDKKSSIEKIPQNYEEHFEEQVKKREMSEEQILYEEKTVQTSKKQIKIVQYKEKDGFLAAQIDGYIERMNLLIEEIIKSTIKDNQISQSQIVNMKHLDNLYQTKVESRCDQGLGNSFMKSFPIINTLNSHFQSKHPSLIESAQKQISRPISLIVTQQQAINFEQLSYNQQLNEDSEIIQSKIGNGYQLMIEDQVQRFLIRVENSVIVIEDFSDESLDEEIVIKLNKTCSKIIDDIQLQIIKLLQNQMTIQSQIIQEQTIDWLEQVIKILERKVIQEEANLIQKVLKEQSAQFLSRLSIKIVSSSSVAADEVQKLIQRNLEEIQERTEQNTSQKVKKYNQSTSNQGVIEDNSAFRKEQIVLQSQLIYSFLLKITEYIILAQENAQIQSPKYLGKIESIKFTLGEIYFNIESRFSIPC